MNPVAKPLDDSLFKINDQAYQFMKDQTGISDEEELKQHILAVQAEAYRVYPYLCIRRFSFLQLKISRLPVYSRLLALGRERADAILLDVGCCFGNDIRKAIADGYPVDNVIGSDLHSEFWELGHKLFKTTQQSFPVPFIPGDVFDAAFLRIASAREVLEVVAMPLPPLTQITSLNQMRGRVSAIHASSFFHLFDEERQLRLARALAGLLLPEPGSMIFGSHGGRMQKGYRAEAMAQQSVIGPNMFCHSPESWKDLWETEVFNKGEVAVEAQLVEVEREDLKSEQGQHFYLLVWAVIRL